ncbi:MAG: MFS transporter [Candidatus Diapherotrites archaeon]
MPLQHVHKQNIIDSNKELKEVYLNLMVSFFAVSMIDLFIPVYLLQLGYSLFDAALFWLVFLLFIAFTYPFSAKLSERIGVKHTILLSAPLLIIFYLSMYSLSFNYFPVLLLAVLLGITKGIYWMPLEIDFIANCHKRVKGREVGYSQVFPRHGRILGSIIGAVVLVSFGFQSLFLFVVVILIASIIPLFTSKDFPPKTRDHWDYAFSGSSLKYFFGAAVEGTYDVFESFLWPLFIFFSFGGLVAGKSIYSIGFASSILVIATIVFAFIAGKKTDQGKGRQMLLIGAAVGFFSALAAVFASSEAAILLISFLVGIGIVMRSVPFTEYMFSLIRRQSIEGGLIVREAGLTLGRIISFSAFFLLGFAFPQAFTAVFIITAIASAYFLVVKLE